MVPTWNSKKIANQSKEDFESAWEKTKDLVTKGTALKKSKKSGKPHPVFDVIQKIRKAYIGLGFEEIINPVFIEDTEVIKQFGPESVAVLDRCYYLAGLPRPDIGISDKKLVELKKINPNVTKESLESVLRQYKKGEIGGDDLVAELSLVLSTDDTTALKALDKIFPEFKTLKPKVQSMTLRSHMTSGWFLTLQSLFGNRDMPLKLFSIDRCFRREQQEDRGHLRTYHSASCVVLDENVSLEDGKEIVKEVFKTLGIVISSLRPDEKRSKYYAPDTQFEVFGVLPSGEEVEVATLGMYSPVALSRYGIETPVFNIGIGVERIAMLTSGATDIRELTYPQFYQDLEIPDNEIASSISIDKKPTSEEGKVIARKIEIEAIKNASQKSPCSFLAYEGRVSGRRVRVSVVEEEENTKLLGPAALNNVYVYESGVYGISKNKGDKEVLENGTDTDITYIRAIANLAAYEIEKAGATGEKNWTTQIKGVKLPSDINLKISETAVRFINSKNKKIDIRGPVFTTIKAEFD